MRLGDDSSNALTLTVTGYQFPDHPDLRVRYSWHMVAGEVRDDTGTWSRHQAVLTCDETPQLSSWLRAVASWREDPSLPRPKRLWFTEPCLEFTVDNDSLIVGFDLEWLPPWTDRDEQEDHYPYFVGIPLQRIRLVEAADAWDAEWAPWPDGLS